ncbi:MAG: GNAT family protein [Candidatus Omnitrophica bacterium]|nr:GNAT family protein [Candidatus Omnitrophota bacterium]
MIRGKKVILRPLEESDLDFCQVLYNDEHIRDMVVGWDFPSSKKNQKIWFESLIKDKRNIRFIVETKKRERLGLTGLWNIDWHNRSSLTAIKLLVTKKTAGKGYGRDAIMVMNAFSFFNVGLHKLWCEILDYNIPSLKAYTERSGWKIEGKLRKHIFKNGSYHNLYFIGCLKEDFLSVPDSNEYIPSSIPEGMRRILRKIDPE